MQARASILRHLVPAALLAAVPAAALAKTLVTAPSLVYKTPGADFRVGTGDDGTFSGPFGPNLSGANARGAASYILLKQDGSIPATGNDFDYIIFFDGTLDLSADLAMSTASTLVMNLTGGALQTTPEFVPRHDGSLTGLTGQASFNLTDGSATAQLSGQFSSPEFASAIMNQNLSAAPGMSVVVMRPSFGSSGNPYVDTVLTPLVPASASDITLIEFTGTASGTVACCMTFGVRGVFALFGTDGTTTTTLPPGACTTFQACTTVLDGTLPPTSNPNAKMRATAKQLTRLAGAAKTKLAKAQAATKPGKQKRLFKSARSTLNALLKAATKANTKGRLSVKLQPIADAVNALLGLIPPP